MADAAATDIGIVDEGGDAIVLVARHIQLLTERGVIAPCRDRCAPEGGSATPLPGIPAVYHVVSVGGTTGPEWARLINALRAIAANETADRVAAFARLGPVPPVDVLVPAAGVLFGHGILPGSGIVGHAVDETRLLIDFYGTRTPVANVRTYADCVHIAASRHQDNAPTHARRTVPRDEMFEIGQWDGVLGRVVLRDDVGRALLEDWLETTAVPEPQLEATAYVFEMRRWNRTRPRCAYSLQSESARFTSAPHPNADAHPTPDTRAGPPPRQRPGP